LADLVLDTADTSEASIDMYMVIMNAWVNTGSGVYPFFYRSSDGVWLEYLEIFDITIPERNVSPAWVEEFGEAKGVTVIAPFFTVVAEVPLSYETVDKNGMKQGWFGWYDDRNYPWVYQREHQWVYIHGLDPANIWSGTKRWGTSGRQKAVIPCSGRIDVRTGSIT
jgi:hypothetical protein